MAKRSVLLQTYDWRSTYDPIIQHLGWMLGSVTVRAGGRLERHAAALPHAPRARQSSGGGGSGSLQGLDMARRARWSLERTIFCNARRRRANGCRPDDTRSCLDGEAAPIAGAGYDGS